MAEQQLPIRLIRAAVLESVRLVRLDAEARIRSADELTKPSLNIGYGSRLSQQMSNGFFVVARVESNVRDERAQNADSALQITADFELHYSHPKELAPSESEINVFCETNAILNAWPYLRELLQSVSLRMGLPPVLLPLYRLSGMDARDESASGSERESVTSAKASTKTHRKK